MQLIKNNKLIKEPENIQSYILEKYGISTQVLIKNNSPIIRVDNYISLHTLIKKIKDDFSFTVYHPKKTDSYIIKIDEF